MMATLATVATIYGVGGALAVLLQARQILTRHASDEISLRYWAVYVGGYAVWLAYGLACHDAAMIISNVAGLACGTFTFAVAVMFHTQKGQTS